MEVQLFNSPQFGQVRTAGTPDNPLFCLADICRILELQTGATRNRIDQKGISLINTPTQGGSQPLVYVNEKNLYKVIMRSDKPQAEPFQDWVCGEVLPAIRKTGGYIPVKPEETPAETMARALIIANNTLKMQEQRIQALEGDKKLLEVENQKLAPMANYAVNVLQSVDNITFEEMAKELNFGSVRKFLDQLLKDRIVFRKRQQTSRGYRYLPYVNYSTAGLFDTRTHHFYHNNGDPGSSVSTVITEKGRRFFHEKYDNDSKPIDLSSINPNLFE